MAASNFARCLKKVLVHEGGNVDDKRDPGGRTSRGVTQAVYDAFRRGHGQAKKDVFAASDAEVAELYRTGYWDKLKGDSLPLGIDYAAFDGGVNSGVSRSAKWLQKALGLKQDGTVGAYTVGSATNADARKTIVSMCAARMGFLRGLSTFKTFGKGWARRVAEVEAAAVAMALSATLPAASVASEMKAESAKAASAAKAQKASAATAGGSGGATVTQVDPSQLHSWTPWIVGGCVLALAVLALVLIHKSRVNKQRAEAYAAAAQEQST